MYCKNCGKEIDDSSRYCKFCGTDLSENEISRNPDKNGSGYRTNVQLDGKINHSLDPNQVTSIKAFLQSNAVLICTYSIWFILNVVFWAAGEDENGFWPYNGNDHLSWDLDRYGLTEFLVYVLLIPFVTLSMYKGLIKIYDSRNPEKHKENKINVIVTVIIFWVNIALVFWLSVS